MLEANVVVLVVGLWDDDSGFSKARGEARSSLTYREQILLQVSDISRSPANLFCPRPDSAGRAPRKAFPQTPPNLRH